jgi:pyruvate dehydrogenase E2 component (dihydrolipoamide acetyltransferase)
MDEGTIVRWLKSEGERVAKDELLFELETDKALVEVPAPAEGVLIRILTRDGPARVESIVGWIGEPGETAGDDTVPPQRARERVIATPAARRRAQELGIDIAAVKGTGPGGRISEQDVAGAAPAPFRPAGRKTLADQVTAAWQSVPHIYIARELDVAALRAAHETQQDLSVTDLLLFVLSRVLPGFPEIAPTTDLAVAVGTDRGVVTPIIRNAGVLDVNGISGARRALMSAAREHRIRLEDIQGGSFTLTNLGMEDVDFFSPIINAPQTAILAVGAMREKPVVSGGGISIGWRMWATLALDHRVADGVYGARFLAELGRAIDRLPEQCTRRENG